MTTLQSDRDKAVSTGSFSEWLFPGFFIVVGFAIVFIGVRSAARDYASADWPKAKGSVRSSMVRRSTNKNGVSYQADIVYDYAVAGMAYSGDQVSFSQFGLGSSDHAQSIVDRYPKGAKVQVSYAPVDPTLSVLETGLTLPDTFLPLGGTVFLIAGYYLGPSRQRRSTVANAAVARN
jgi:Protein of unknown function (DUF3592)